MSSIPYHTFEKDFKFEKNLGQGNCATVSQVYHILQKKSYALKRITVPNNQEQVQAFGQIEAIKSIDDQKATRVYYYYSFHNQQNGNYQLGIIMELCKQSLSQLIRMRKKKKIYFKAQEVKIFLNSLVPFFAKMQRKEFLHRDIKPDNILLAKTRETDYRVADFGYAIKEGHYSSRNVAGTMEYVSPKLLVKFKDHKKSVEGHNIKDDVYSFGKTLSQFMTLEVTKEFNSDKIKDCLHRYGKQLTNVILMTTKQNQEERLDFIQLEQYLLNKNLIDSSEKQSQMNSANLAKARMMSLDSNISTSPKRKLSQIKTKANSKGSRATSPVGQMKTKRKVTQEQSASTLINKKQNNNKPLPREWDKKVMPLKQQIYCLQICDTLLFLGMQDKLGIMIIDTCKLIKFSNVNSLKDIYCLKVSPDKQFLLLGTLQSKLCCIPILELKKLMLNNNESFRLKNSLDINLQGLKCKEYSLSAPISTFDLFYPESKTDPTIVVGHHTGEITIINNNRFQRKFTFSTEPITNLAISQGAIYTSTSFGLFRKQTGLSLGLTVDNLNKTDKIKETYLSTFRNNAYKCSEAITTFRIISNCKKNLQIEKQGNQYLAILVCWDGIIQIISKSMKCQMTLRLTQSNLLGATFSPAPSQNLGLEGYIVDQQGTIFNTKGQTIYKTEEKDLVALVSTGQNIFCGGFEKKIVSLKAKDIVNLE